MALWTSILTRNREVDLVSFDGTTAIFRINGTPKMRDVERLLREAYEHGLCTAEEYRDYYRKHNPFNSKKNDVAKLREAYEQGVYSANDIRELNRQFYGTKEYWEYYEKRIAPSMIQRDPSPRPMTFEPAKPKKKDRTLLKSIVLLFLLLLPNGLFFWSLLFKMLGSGI